MKQLPPHYSRQTHLFAPGRGHNVMCFNGSAHIRRTSDKTKVTCPKCKAKIKDRKVGLTDDD